MASVTNPFYNPGNFYGGTQDWTTTPFVKDYLDPQIPQGVYQSYLTRQNLGGNDALSQFAQSLYGRTQYGYQAALRNNPNLTYNDYLNQQFGQIGGSLRDLYFAQDNSRGSSLWGTSPGNRVIAWG